MNNIIIVGDVRRDARDIAARAARAAGGFEALGVGSGDVVALCLHNDFAFFEVSLGAGQVGAYVTPLNWHSSAEEIAYLLTDSGAKVFVVHADLLVKLAPSVPAGVIVLTVPTPSGVDSAQAVFGMDEAGPLAWEMWLDGQTPRAEPPCVAPGTMMYTSGTTGRPKGVRRHPPKPEHAAQRQQMFVTLTGMGDWMSRPGEVTALIPGPLYHATPNAWAMALFGLGADVIVERRFDPEALLRRIEARRVTHVLTVPTMLVRLLRLSPEMKARYELSSLAFVSHGAAPCPPQVKRDLIDWLGPILHEHYGGTETAAVTACTTAEWLDHPGTVGRALDGVRVAILDEEGRLQPPGTVGNVYCRNPALSDFVYHGDPDKRARAERGGLIGLGDIGYLDEDGFLYLCARSGDIVISGGVNIYPVEIEAELMKAPGVADCAVFGIPDEEFGESLCAHVQPLEGWKLEVDELRSFLRRRLSAFKAPKRFEFSTSLPREDSGKIFKRALREPYWAAEQRSI